MGLIYKSSLAVKVKSSSKDVRYSHFEHMDCMVSLNGVNFRLAVIYRPPPSRENKLKNIVFFDEWSSFLSEYVTLPGEILIVGDLNFHIDNPTDTDSLHFMSSLEIMVF